MRNAILTGNHDNVNFSGNNHGPLANIDLEDLVRNILGHPELPEGEHIVEI